jgi:hypothetical protein
MELCEVLGSESSGDEDFCPLGYDTVQIVGKVTADPENRGRIFLRNEGNYLLI